MNKLYMILQRQHKKMDAATGTDGASGAGGVSSAQGGTPPAQGTDGTSAAAAHASSTPPAQGTDGTSAAAAHAQGGTPSAQGTDGTSAAAAHAGSTPPAQGTDGKPSEPSAPDYEKMTDEDYAKAVIPDAKAGEEEPDRSLISLMAKDLREQKIDPATVAKISQVYNKAVAAEIEKRNKAETERLATLRTECEKAITPEEWRSFAPAYQQFIASDKTLKALVDTTELGSNAAFIRLVALAGTTIRVDAPPPATAAAGSGQTDLDRRVFLATVPKDLR